MLRRKEIKADLCVIGAGMAGICTAISAARNGIKVVLMHERAVLGGNASSEIRMWICGSDGENNRETGIIEEIMLENLYRNPTKNYFIWDSILYDFVTREENITLLLNCTCMDAQSEKGNFADGRNTKITSVTGYQMTTQTFIDVKSKFYADCSGDSILAPLVNAEFMIGREAASDFGENTYVTEKDNTTMGMSCLVQGRETTKPVKYTPPTFSKKLSKEDFENRNPDLYDEYENFWYLELGGMQDTIHDTEEINKELIPLATGTWDYIKNSGEFNSDNWELEFLGFLPGKRESRRMTGEYIITQRDISENKIFEDTVAYGGWPLDDHFPGGFYHKGHPNSANPTPAPYCIPYRALYSKNVENLFFAGRNISATHLAMSSTRVMATCALIGEAVGVAAAIATKNNLTPNGVYQNKLEELCDTLLDADCFLPNKTRKTSELCKGSNFASCCVELCNGQDRANTVYGTKECGISAENGKEISYIFECPEFVHSVHITFDSDLNRNTLPGGYSERQHSMRCNVKLDAPVFHLPKTLCKEFKLILKAENGEKFILEENCNLKRAYNFKINQKVLAITLIPVSNWGESESTNIFSFDFK